MKKNGKRILSVLVVLAAAGILWGVRQQQEKQTAYTKNIFAMNTVFSLKAYGPKAEEALREAEKKVRELEAQFSVTAEDSDIWRVNHVSWDMTETTGMVDESAGEVTDEAADNGGKDAVNEVALHTDTVSVIETALQLGDDTGGAVDITIYPVLREWGFTTGEYRIPEAERIARLLENVDYRQIEICKTTGNSSVTETADTMQEITENKADSSDGSGVIRVPEGVELDLGAVAKGYTGDCLIRIMREAGVTSAILDLGGNVQTLGKKPDGSLWQVAVKNPFDPGEELGVLQVADKAVITSGSYERYFTGEDGNNYWHIIDPADGYPADSGLVSVTVVGERGVVCDGLSTALFVMGKENAVLFWREKRDFDMILVTDDGNLSITEGLADSFRSMEGWSAEIIKAKK